MFGFLNFFKRKPAETVTPSEEPTTKSIDPPKIMELSQPEKLFKPPSKKQLEECERLGLEVKPNMSSREVWQLVKDVLKDPKYKKLYDKYIAEQNAICEAEEREEFGDAVVDEQKKWQKLCSPRLHHIVVFKKDKTLYADILEFESANIEGENEYHVKIEGYRPKIYNPHGEDPRIEWIKVISFRPEQIFEVITLPNQIDIYAIDDYKNALKKAKELKEKYQ